MIIEWTQNRLKGIPCPQYGDITLLPGLNEVNDKAWEIVKPMVKIDYDMQWIKEVKQVKSQERAGAPDKVVTKFSEFDVVVARKAVEDCFNIETLETWLKDEKRDDVRRKIDEQIKMIQDKKPTKKSTKTSSEDYKKGGLI